MKSRASSKSVLRNHDDNLFGLLSLSKSYLTYFRVLESHNDDRIVVQITGNPKFWNKISKDEYADYRCLSRLEIGIPKICVKYLKPEHLLTYSGHSFGVKISDENIAYIDRLDGEGYYILSAPLKFKTRILTGIKRIINMSAQKKYEILEKNLSDSQE
jgi:hypothetical protein